MKRIFTLLTLLFTLTLFASNSFAQSNFDGFFVSEYFEGSSNDKAVEIYNGARSGTSINLSRIRVRVYANGAASPSSTITLGTAADGSTTTLAYMSTFVVYNAGTSWTSGNVATNMPNCPSSRRFSSGSLTHNGDDAIELQVDTTGSGNWKTVDIFGKIGEDPGTAWTAGGVTTLDKSLERSSTVNTGIITNPSSFDPSVQYSDNASITMPNATLGQHTTNAPLPISLVKFTADKISEKVKISWTTATEINNDKFIIERSSDGENFEAISEVRGAGNSREINEYAVVDANPLKGTSYYRLTQVDFDGRSETFAPVAVRMDGKSLVIETISSKQEAGSIEMNIFSPSSKATSIRVIDLSGRTIASENINLVEGYQTVTINAKTLASGIHLIQLMSGEDVVMKKLVL